MDAAKLARYRVLRTQAASMSGDVLLARTQELYDLKPSDEDMQRYANTIDNELKAQGIDVVKPLKDIAAVYIHEALETPDGAQAFAAMRSINIPAREKASTAYESRGRLAHAFPSQWEPSEENHGDEPPPIPMDAIKAQTGFHLGVVRYIMLYGRGSYDYRIVPSLDMQMNLFDCVQKMLDIQNTQEPQLRRQILESPHAWPIQMLFDVYIAGARKVGLSLADVARQFMHDFEVNPFVSREPDGPQRSAWETEAAAKYKIPKLKILKIIAALHPNVVELDAQGEPVWDVGTHGEYAVTAVRIDKATEEEAGEV